jgi:hypothetical protein
MTVLAGEVSLVNDDLTDNFFLEPFGRFSEILEDEPPLYPLWSELEGLVQAAQAMAARRRSQSRSVMAEVHFPAVAKQSCTGHSNDLGRSENAP